MGSRTEGQEAAEATAATAASAASRPTGDSQEGHAVHAWGHLRARPTSLPAPALSHNARPVRGQSELWRSPFAGEQNKAYKPRRTEKDRECSRASKEEGKGSDEEATCPSSRLRTLLHSKHFSSRSNSSSYSSAENGPFPRLT